MLLAAQARIGMTVHAAEGDPASQGRRVIGEWNRQHRRIDSAFRPAVVQNPSANTAWPVYEGVQRLEKRTASERNLEWAVLRAWNPRVSVGVGSTLRVR